MPTASAVLLREFYLYSSLDRNTRVSTGNSRPQKRTTHCRRFLLWRWGSSFRSSAEQHIHGVTLATDGGRES